MIKRHWPILLGVGIFFTTIAILWSLCRSKTGGHFVYTLDDPYIHMAIAKNVIQYGVWGVTPYQFSSSSSSPLWTLGLALADALFGVRDLAPFILNLIFAGLALGLVYILLRPRLPGWVVALALGSVIFFTPLASLVFTGMEHCAHLFFTLLAVALAARSLSEEKPSPGLQRGLLASVFLTTAIRYEGLFLLLILIILFACRKRWRFTLLLAVAGGLPLVVYGIWSAARGWYFLPNPVILKGTDGIRTVIQFLDDVFVHGRPVTWQAVQRVVPSLVVSRINAHPHLLFLIFPSLILLVYRKGGFWKTANVTNTAFLGSALLHVQFAGTGWFFRYEAYLMAFGIYAVAAGLADHPLDRFKEVPLNPPVRKGDETRNSGVLGRSGVTPPLPAQNINISEISPSSIGRKGLGDKLLRLAALLLLAILVSFPLRVRAAKSLWQTPKASYNIFEQQYQMALFLRQYYQGQAVAANDIGAIDYIAEFQLVDLAGLGTRESAAYKLKQTFGARQVAEVAKIYGTQIALVYDTWFPIPATWIKIGEWQILDNVVCGDDTVSFYAVNPAAATGLTDNLRAFAPRLPADVIQNIYR